MTDKRLQGKCSVCGLWLVLWNGVVVDCHLNDDADDLCPGGEELPLETREDDGTLKCAICSKPATCIGLMPLSNYFDFTADNPTKD